MPAYVNSGKISAKGNSGQDSILAERDSHTLRRTVPKNHATTATQVTAEVDILETLRPSFHKNLSDPELHKYNIHGKATTAEPLTIAESNVQMRDHKTWTSEDWK
jgi:hypothetical protein